MTEPLRTDPATAPVTSAAADQAARIEQLLLTGLDYYFAGHYEHAINVWTRIVFLERGHGRARAYIERARSAMAERERACEELLHRGVSAYHAGDVERARAYLTQAIEEGASSDDALLLLQRLNRVDAAASLRQLPVGGGDPLRHGHEPPAAVRHRRVGPGLAAIAIASASALGAAPLVSWLLEGRGPSPADAVQYVAPEPLPIVRTAETTLTQARGLYAAGRLHDALGVLARIEKADPLAAEAERLTGDIQRDLLSVARANRAAVEAEPRR